LNRYWIDANAIIWTNRKLSPYDTARVYWNWLETKLEDGSVVTHKNIYGDVVAGLDLDRPDPIAQWLKNRRCAGLLHGDTEESQKVMGDISNYVLKTHKHSKNAYKFLKSADPHLIARAYVEKEPVVTQESVDRELRIPRICNQFGVRCLYVTDMNLELQFNLDRELREPTR
jgi:hypothetical protein